MLTLLSLSGAFTLGLTASSPPQHKLWEPCLLTHIPLCFMWPQAAHYPVPTLEPRCGLASFFLSSSQALGSLGIEPSSACSVLAYHLLPSSHPIHHSHTCVTSKASAGTRATDLEGHLINSLFLIGSLQILLGVFRAFFFPMHLQPPPPPPILVSLSHVPQGCTSGSYGPLTFSLYMPPDRTASAFLCPLEVPPASCLHGLCEHRV